MIHQPTITWWLGGTAIAAFAAVLSVLLIVFLRPLLARYALAKPNARSSHASPTPQGGGIAVVAATIVTACAGLYSTEGAALPSPLPVLFAATVFIALVGAADDIRPVGAIPRLALQAVAVASVIYALPEELRVVPWLSWWIERVLLVVGGIWFVNLVNFMDGLDWMTAVETVPITVTLAVIGSFGLLSSPDVAVALALCGATVGFAYFNRPVAKLFLGDVGSLPIGLLVGWLLLSVAATGHLAAAILMPLYYLADATVTLFRRLAHGEPFWRAHRTHFYQLATERGFKVIDVVSRVFLVNVGLCALAVLTVIRPYRATQIAALIVGSVIVTGLLFVFARGKARSK
jgi:UDP-N-acetylmuramyl pentapeptide phosphotransferase/UDP-N-acetylglucosamine-1-phosphate transferase